MKQLALSLCLFLCACGSNPVELSVDVRTDLEAATEFAQIRIELTEARGAAQQPVIAEASPDLPWTNGVRVADFRGLPQGTYRAEAILLDAGGGEVLSRAIELTMLRDYALTIVLTRDCTGRSCPGATEPASFTECVSGACVDPRCGGPTPEGCGTVSCTTQSECADVLDCAAACIEGACVCAGEIGDGGGCECAAGEVGEEERPCGACGEGVERRPRECGEDCLWVPIGDWGSCETDAECAPGAMDMQSEGCGNCGTHTRTRSCDDATCRWAPGEWGGCTGEGVCSPGSTLGGCDRCGHQVCQGNCQWGGCELRPGGVCFHEGGTNYRCCMPGRWQYCLPSTCNWSTDCSSCSACEC